MNRHLCLVVALLIPILVVVPTPISQAGTLSLWAFLGGNSPQSHDAQAVSSSVFTNLEAQLIGKHIQVNWQLNTHLDVAYFAIEKSDHDRPFGFVGGLNLNKAVSSSEAFQFVDLEKPLQPTAVYRIKLVLSDGQQLYSDPVKASYGLEITAHPAPVHDMLTLTFPPLSNQPFHIRIFDQMGHPVKGFDSNLVQPGEIQVNMSQLPAGLYILQINGAQQSWHERILKL